MNNLIEKIDRLLVSENKAEMEVKAKEYLDYYIKKVGKNQKKVRREIETNVVGNAGHPNAFVEMVWNEFNKRFPS